jgi:hypothetical protein
MRWRWLLLSVLLLLPSQVLAEGTQFNGTCATISWNANTESDLAGYYLHDRSAPTSAPATGTYGPQITSVGCPTLGLNPGQHYISLSAFDTSGNVSAESTQVPFVLVVTNSVADLRAQDIQSTQVTLAWTEVDDGAGSPAKYQVRQGSPTIDWGSAPAVSNGTCAGVVTGSSIGATKTCTVTSLTNATIYQFQLVPYRGTLGVDAVFGPLSNVLQVTTGALSSTYVTLYTDSFTRANEGPITTPWQGGYTSLGNLAINTNAVRQYTASSDDVATYNADLDANQWAQATIKTWGGTADMWGIVLVRATDPATHTAYKCTAARYAGNWSSAIEKVIAGSNTVLTSESSTTWAANDIIRCDADGSTIRMYRNGVQLLSTIDVSISGIGNAGLEIANFSGATTDLELDEFKSGTLSNRIILGSDTFTRADSTDLGTQWSWGYANRGPSQLVSNAARPLTPGVETLEAFTGASLPDDQWAQVKLTNITGSGWNGVVFALRLQDPATKTHYGIAITDQTDSNAVSIGRCIAGSCTTLQTATTTWANGDTARVEVIGSTLSVYQNDVLVTSYTDVTPITSGPRAGLGLYAESSTANVIADDWVVGGYAQTSVTPGGTDPCAC